LLDGALMADADLLRAMWRIRVFEEEVGRLTRADEVHGLVHLSVGGEGVAVGDEVKIAIDLEAVRQG